MKNNKCLLTKNVLFDAGYQQVLSRICNTATVSNALKTEVENAIDRYGGRQDDDPQQTPETTASSFDVVRTPIYGARWALRLARLHSFFAEHLQVSSFLTW